MNTYNQFEVLNIGEEARIEAITYKVLDREDFKNTIELVVKDYTNKYTYSIYLNKINQTVIHEDGYKLTWYQYANTVVIERTLYILGTTHLVT